MDVAAIVIGEVVLVVCSEDEDSTTPFASRKGLLSLLVSSTMVTSPDHDDNRSTSCSTASPVTIDLLSWSSFPFDAFMAQPGRT